MTFNEWLEMTHFNIYPDTYQEECLKQAFEAGYSEGYDDAAFGATGGHGRE